MSNTPYAMSPADAARWIGVSRSTLYRLISRGEIPVVKVGRRTLLLSEHLMAFVTGRSQSRTWQARS